MDARGAFVFGGALDGAEASTVLTTAAGEPVSTDGPLVASKDQIAGFYVIRAADPAEARDWGQRSRTPQATRSNCAHFERRAALSRDRGIREARFS